MSSPRTDTRDVASLIPTQFAADQKSSATYLDVAANAHGSEKSLLVHRALQRSPSQHPQLVEIGPGGGAAVLSLAAQLRASGEHRPISLTLIENPQVTSESLCAAIDEFNTIGHCTLRPGLAQDLDHLLPHPVDVISASALVHEVYSYGGGYQGIHHFMRTLPAVLTPGGCFAYRDVYAVDGTSLHERTRQSYEPRSWLLFLRMFVPQYLQQGQHPYHHATDELVARQNSRVVPVAELDPNTGAFLCAPIGQFREIQRHYLTFRDHVWRSGALGFSPILEGQFAADWIDISRGHKRVHFRLTDAEWLSPSQKAMLLAVSESYADHYAIDGDFFDEFTDVALTDFLEAVDRGDTAATRVWSDWIAREGRETYAYLTLDELVADFAMQSVEAAESVMIPMHVGDVIKQRRHYYNRYLAKRLANPLCDAKQLVLFQNVPLSEVDAVRQGLRVAQSVCGKESLARLYMSIKSRG